MSNTEIPRSVLSEHFQERLQGRRVLGTVFLTYRFDPGFFEQDILPAFLDVPLSHVQAIRLVQLEDALREVPEGVAVYYDSNGLIAGGAAAKLDVRRVPVCHRTGVFHPKNVFLLVEELEPDGDGRHPQSLLVACLSANLTRSGWWDNVEVCHCEEIEEGERTRIKDDLRRFLLGLERRVGDKAPDGHRALRAIRGFLKDTSQRSSRSRNKELLTHFYDGSTPLVDFIDHVAGSRVRGTHLEIISPYFNEDAGRLPLQSMCDRFQPREVRVFLPRAESGEALCSPEVLEHVRSLEGPSVSGWGLLPSDLTSSGKGVQARNRLVHAKTYRFFNRNERREILFIGSPNLTSSAHQRGGNLETGFLVEVRGGAKADWWLEADNRRSINCKPPEDHEDVALVGGTRLCLRYSWSAGDAAAYWDDMAASPAMLLLCQGVELFPLPSLSPGTWHSLKPEQAEVIGAHLISSSIFTVHPEGGPPGVLLVQEEGMHSRPSLIRDLTPGEILKYWSLLTPAQRADFLTARARELHETDEGVALLAKVNRVAEVEGFFDRFAGMFLSFANLETSIREALEHDRMAQAAYRVFGEKHDSLPSLLRKVEEEVTKGTGDLTEHFVTLLCARQLASILRKDSPDFFHRFPIEAGRLEGQLELVDVLRDRLASTDQDMPPFLEWFEKWFLRRAAQLEAEPA